MKHRLDSEISFIKMLLFINLAYQANHIDAQISFGLAAAFFCVFGLYQLIDLVNNRQESPCKTRS